MAEHPLFGTFAIQMTNRCSHFLRLTSTKKTDSLPWHTWQGIERRHDSGWCLHWVRLSNTGQGPEVSDCFADQTLLLCRLKAQYPGRFKVAVQHFARKAAKGEVEGTDGYFVTKEAFQAMVGEGRFAEHREVAGGVLVGTTYQSIHKVQPKLPVALLFVS